METKESKVALINKEINLEMADPAVGKALLATTFKGLDALNMKKALMEGMVRGFTFQNFLKKDVYAIPFAKGYSLITSIGYSRKIGAKSGVVGVKKPEYEMDGDKIVSCTVTVLKKTDDYIGEYSSTVYFKEFTTGKNLWVSKPRVMIAKVAEMHSLRKACPEELAQAYVEEEMHKENTIEILDEGTKKTIDEIKTVEALNDYYSKNSGKGKAFDAYIFERKVALEEIDENS